MNWRKDSLGYYEFVLPIVSIVEKVEKSFVRHFSEVNRKNIERSSQIVLSGTALKDHATLQCVEEFGWIRECEKPILGICAGMQTLGLVFGASLKKSLEIGMAEINTTKENPLFSSTYRAYELHNCAIEASAKFEVLAESEKCVQAIKLKTKEIYGVLFHPEVRNKEILQRFTSLKT
jgi:GMP synthase (glutamine-hydrolysing)